LKQKGIINMKTPFTGGCACGAIRYECTAKPKAMVECHCRDCQRAMGGPGFFAVVVPADAFKLTRGTLRYYFTESERMGLHRRSFCADCGSPLTGAENRDGTMGSIAITAASLDDPSEFHPQMHFWILDAQPWAKMDPAVPKFEKYPPQVGAERAA
jgi:hypothetical protein